ncbi:hypothetical protein AAFX15_03240 [Vibrio chagasii]|uniref:hypothetical protein n=1 Tax=Vibrio chagasii TaxID=170679 RepID=UPI0038CEC0BF
MTKANDTDNLEYFHMTKAESPPEVDFSSIFDHSFNDHGASPIELFLDNFRNVIKLVYVDNVTPTKCNLILLGLVSAAESYVRSVIRRLILCDNHIFSLAMSKNVTFAAAQYHNKDTLPEALIEHCSFANSYKIFSNLNEFIGMPTSVPPELSRLAEQYNKICELRHCCVHRFGKLGIKNAIKLDLIPKYDPHDASLNTIEKPILLNENNIQDIGVIIETFIKTLNNQIFKFILQRTVGDNQSVIPKYKQQWVWQEEVDIDRFTTYYKIFATQGSMSASEAYLKFSEVHKPDLETKTKQKTKSKSYRRNKSKKRGRQ